MSTLDAQRIQAALDDTSIARPVEVHHVNIKTRDLVPMRDWYAQLLGAEVLYENGLVCFLTYDTGHHRVAFLANPDLDSVDPGRAGFEHVGFLYRGLDELLAAWQAAHDRGVVPFWTTNHGPSISFYYRDPDGNTVELQADRFADIDAAIAWFETGDFDRNPIGVDVAPERLVAERAAGVPADELFARSRESELI